MPNRAPRLARRVRVCRDTLPARPRTTVAAIGICSQVNTHVFVDADLAPVHPAISWQDQRCADAAAELERRAGDDIERIFGGPFAIHASYALSRALWMSRRSGRVGSDSVDPVAKGLLHRHSHRGGAHRPCLASRARRRRRRLPRRALALVDGAVAKFPPLDEFDATGRGGPPGRSDSRPASR